MKSWSTIIFACFCIMASAQDFSVILSSGNKFDCSITSSSMVSVACRNAKGALVIPERVSDHGDTYTVTSINRKAFYRNEITSITIPKTITTIEARAFEECQSLETIILPSNVKSLGRCQGELDGGTFYNCKNLKMVVLSQEIKVIPYKTFYGCSNLKNIVIPEGVTAIHATAFENCVRLRTVKLPLSLEQIFYWSFMDEIFYKCPSLEQIIIPAGSREKFEKLLPKFADKLVEE